MRYLTVVVMFLAAGWVHGMEEGQNPVNTSTNELGAERLWTSMHEAGMIDAEQYRHVLESGCLPGGTVITNSPLAVESQKEWNRLAEHGVITAPELAAMLFNGDIPGLTAAEEKAFIELAPVYQPDRAKRLGYEVRRKHIKVDSIRLSHRFRKEQEQRRVQTEARAKELGIPLQRGDSWLTYIDDHGHPHYTGLLGIGSCDTISTDELWPTNAAGQVSSNLNLTGSGVTLALWDLRGVWSPHQEFYGRVSHPSGSMGRSVHANTIAAIMAGAGVNTNAMGMAYTANLNAYDFRTASQMAQLPQVAGGGQVFFSNHSYVEAYLGWEGGIWQGSSSVDPYEDYRFGRYGSYDAVRDEIVYSAYYHLPVHGTGNDRDDAGYGHPRDDQSDNSDESFPGYDTLSGGIAKNVLTLGAVGELTDGYAGASNVTMSAYSSFGPTDDGRIKPDLVASGFSGAIPSIYSNSGYLSATGYGTSYAAPAATGSLGLLQQLNEQLHGTNSTPLLASTWKGLVLHTADETGDHPGPDYRFGWGLMNTLAAAELMRTNTNWNSRPFIKEFTLPEGEQASFNVEKDPDQPLRITICWTDPPGPVQPNYTLDPTNRVLVHDIDLRVIDSNGTTNFPWVLNPFMPTNAATTGDNVLDNVEQVVVDNSATGQYTVVVGHKGTLEESGCQEVSMILSGILPEDINPNFSISMTTNGWPKLEWNSAVGATYAVEGTSDLRIPSWWTPLPGSTQSVLRVNHEWVDTNSNYTGSARFYRLRPVN